MADSANKPAAEPKAKTVADDMDSRRIFATVDEAIAYLTACSESFTDFGDIPLAGAGLDSEGNFDPAIYTDEMQVMVSTLSKKKGGIKCIVVAPIPSLDAILADDAGREWLINKVLNKELNHVAVRALREADDVSTVIDQMPTSRDAYISSGRGDGGGILETFKVLFKQLNDTMSKNAPVWAKARLIKTDFQKALENRGFALEYFPALENRGEGKPSLFVLALQLGITAAKKKGLDPTIFNRWLETRDAKQFDPADDDADELDVDSLMESLTDSETAEAPDTTQAEADAPTA